jgi:peptide/nickel transport system substrate-binding protein
MKRLTVTTVLVCLAFVAASLLSCGPTATPEVVEKVVKETVVVEKEVEVTKVVEVEKEVVVTVEVEKVDEAELERRKTVIFDIDGTVTDPENWNPYAPGRNVDMGLVQSMAEPLFAINTVTGQIEAWLGESMTPNDDFTVWTLKLREGTKWSDGEVLDADDVIFTVNMLQDHPDLHSPLNFDTLESVEKVDDRTIEFTLKEPDPRFQLESFANVLSTQGFYTAPEHIWKDQEDPVTFTNYDPDKGWPVYSGAYLLESVTENQFQFVRNENWWGAESGWRPLPAPEKLVWLEYGSEEITVAAMAKNDMDLLSYISPGSFQVLQTLNPNVIAWRKELPYSWIDPCTRCLEFNHTKAPWDDPEMRWAINYALDRDQIVDITFEGFTAPSLHFFAYYPPLKRLVDLAESEGLYEKYPVSKTDPDLAKQIIESKGYTLNSATGYYEKDGQEFKVTIANFDAPNANTAVGIVVEQLQSIGINAVQDIQTIPDFIDNLLNATFVDAYLFFGACGSTVDPWRSMDSFSVRHLPEEPGQPVDSYYHNAWRWNTEVAAEYSEIVAEIGTLAPGDPQIDTLFLEATDLWLQDLPVIPLWQQPALVPLNTTYWTNFPSEENPYIQPSHWWPGTHIMIHSLKPVQQE